MIPASRLPSGAGHGGAGFWHRLGRQLAHPEGPWGRVAGRLMAVVNAAPYRAAIAALDLEARPCRLLEIGCGPGAGLTRLDRQMGPGRLVGLDGAPAMLELAARRNRDALEEGRLSLVEGDFRRLPWADGAFDRVLAVNVAYFFDPEGVAVGEIARVLTPDGRAVLYVTDRATMARWPFAGPDTHVTYDAGDLRRLLERGGFSPEEIEIQPVHLPLKMDGLLAVATRRRA